MKITFGDYLLAWRAYKGWSQPDLYVKSGVAVSTISRLESRFDRKGKEIKPSPQTKKKLAKAFGVTPEELSGWPPNYSVGKVAEEAVTDDLEEKLSGRITLDDAELPEDVKREVIDYIRIRMKMLTRSA